MLLIRPATVNDVTLLRTMIRELAEFEHELDAVTITEEDLARDGFGRNPKYRAFILMWEGKVAGYGLVFDCYSTWMGRQLFLEDLFVRDDFRGRGIGKSVFAHFARLAKDEGYRAMRWEVLEWNQPAIDLYRSLGGEFLDDWKLVMLRGEALDRLAEQGSECKK
jgi:ribosomal protein S18 acetylase RimI-like enzyme